MSDETPTTDQVREEYAHLRYHYADGWSIGEERVLFDRWLAEHDRKVKAEGRREGYQTARDDMLSGAFVGGPTYEALRDSFTGRRVQAETLREAARDWSDWDALNAPEDWLNRRADRIEADHA